MEGKGDRSVGRGWRRWGWCGIRGAVGSGCVWRVGVGEGVERAEDMAGGARSWALLMSVVV